VRREVIEILNRTRPTGAGFKGIEGSAQMKDTGRAEVEGVLQEAALSAGMPPLRRVKSQIKADVRSWYASSCERQLCAFRRDP